MARNAPGHCLTCLFFEWQGDEDEQNQGTCRRMPPAACYDPEDGRVATCWPTVDWMDWCGEHRTQ